MLRHPSLLLVALLLSASRAADDGFVEVPDDAPMPKGELDAISQIAGSDKMKGMKLGKREVAPDGKSGRIFLEPEGGSEPTKWNPQFSTDLKTMRKTIESEDIVLVYFFSSAENQLSESHMNGEKFEKAAQQLIEDDRQVTLLMLDVEKHAGRDMEFVRQYGVYEPHKYKLFINSKTQDYRGRNDVDGLVAHMRDLAGPPSTKLETTAELDAVLANATWTVVVGIFGPAYQGKSSREVFAEAARELRDSGRLSFVEVSTRVANNAAVFAAKAANTPFDSSMSEYAVVLSQRWIRKEDVRYHLASDFRKMHSFVGEHTWTSVAPFSEALVKHTMRARKGARPMLMASLVLDTRKHAPKLRYIVRQLHKLVEALGTEVAAGVTLAITHRATDGNVEKWFYDRFERTTVGKEFFNGEKFGLNYCKDFTLIVSDPRSEKNWVSNAIAGATPDGAELVKLAPFLAKVVNGEVPHLAQGDAAAAAAGLKEMSMGFDNNMQFKETGNEPARKHKKKSKKAKATADKREL